MDPENNGSSPIHAAAAWAGVVCESACEIKLGEAFDACRGELSTAVEHGVDKAVDRLASAVQVRARQVESRLITALTGRTGRAAPLAEGASPDADLLTRWQETTAILESLSSLRDAILRHDAARLKVLHQRPDVVVASPPTRIEDEPGPASNQQPDRRSELQEGGCPVCNHLVEAAFNFYAKWQYKLSVDEPTQSASLPTNWGSVHCTPGSLPRLPRRRDSASASQSCWNDCPLLCRASLVSPQAAGRVAASFQVLKSAESGFRWQ